MTEHSTPLADITLTLTDIAGNTLTTHTDEKGFFSFKPLGSWKVFIPVGPQDRMRRWSIMIDGAGGPIPAYQNGGLGGYSRSDEVQLFCDLSRQDDSICRK